MLLRAISGNTPMPTSLMKHVLAEGDHQPGEDPRISTRIGRVVNTQAKSRSPE